MANPFQQRSRLRKLVYIGLILALFTVSLMHRKFIIEAQATALQLREQTQGEVELTSSAVQLLLSGSRGFANLILWHVAMEKQKTRQWNELELYVRSITKLQPHFITPWLFQSWNLSFNVSVECNQARDKYFWITSGLRLLTEGERRNQGSLEEITTSSGKHLKFPGNPEMRHYAGFFYQLKIGNSDERYYMRSLLDLSCIDPADRNPAKFWAVKDGKRVINEKEFQNFCQRNPRLVRRLREVMGRDTTEDVIAFLEDNHEVPSRFEDGGEVGPSGSKLKSPREQFPILPPSERLRGVLPDTGAREFNESFDVYIAAWAWYLYAQEPLPPATRDPAMDPVKVDLVQHRVPKMDIMIFRTYPARARWYAAEEMEAEGWFDEKDGWEIDGWFTDPDGGDRKVRVGQESKYQASPAWHRAHAAYGEYGRQNGLLLEPAEMAAVEARAELFRRTFGVGAGMMTGDLRPEQRAGGMGASFDAHKKLHGYTSYRTLTNFPAFYNQAAVEMKPETVQVRKMFFRAQQLANQGARPEALRAYEAAFPPWLDLLLAYKEFRDVVDVQLETYEAEIRYLKLLQQVRKGQVEILEVKGKDKVERPYRPPQMGLRPVIAGVSQMGLVRLGLSPIVNLPLLDMDEDVEKSILPIKTVRGPFQTMYVCEIPEPARRQWLDLLLRLTQGPLRPPLAMAAYRPNWLLTVHDPGLEGNLPAPWQPLITELAMAPVRQQFGIPTPKAPPRPGEGQAPPPP